MSDRLGYDIHDETYTDPPDVFGAAQSWNNDAELAIDTPTTQFSKNLVSADLKKARVIPRSGRTRDKKFTIKREATERDCSGTVHDFLGYGVKSLPTNAPLKLESPNTSLQISPCSVTEIERVQPKDPEPVPLASLLRRHRVISHFIEDSIELHNPPEPVVEHESENEDEGHDIFGGLVGKTENFWILQSSAVVEIENARKQQLIDEIVRVVVEALQSEANSSAQDGEVPETPTCPNTYSTDISPTKSEGSNHTGKRKTRRTTPAGESDNEDSGSEENDKSPKSAKYVSQASLGLACPYFKRNPQKYRSHRTCVGPGWGSVHRVKEHIFRNHKLPKFQFNRCRYEHASMTELKAHQRSNIPCPLRDEEMVEGIDGEQEAKLKSRRKEYTKKTEPEKWHTVYRILFPGDDPEHAPSPYYEYSSENCQTVRSDGHDILARYQAYLQKELPTCIQQELEETFEFELDISQQTVKTKAIETLMSLQRRSFEEFMKSEGLSVQSQLVARQKTTHKSQHQLDTDAARCGNAITVPTVAQLPSLDEPGFDPHKDIYTHPLSFSEEVMDISWSSNILAVNQNPDVPNEERARDFKPPANLLWHQPENISHFGADLRIDWEWHDE